MIGGAKGIGIGIDFGIPNQYCRATSKPYIEKEVLDSLRVVASAYGKSNDDADRSIVKNLVDASNPFIISNAAFKLNSGFGEYKEDFTSWRIYPNIKVTDNVITTNGNFNSTWFIYKHSSESKINEMNIKVSGIPKGGKILYFYISDETANLPIAYTIPKDGIYHLPESKINNNRISVGFTVESRYDWNNIRIEQIPSFEGAFVTDGIDDLITSTKTVQEMLGGSNEMTIISLIGVLSGDSENKAFINTIYPDAGSFIRNTALNADNGKLGCFGYSVSNINNYISNSVVINNILGDKNDYIVQGGGTSIIEGKLSVVGRHYNNGSFSWQCQAAWYWTIIANKVLTTDQINQVIAYFNLDRTLKPDILCDVKKQGITNDNHAEFGDKLIDYSGNGRYIQLNNIAWKGDSGIGKYEVDFLDSIIWNSSNSTITSSKIDCKNAISHIMLLYYNVGSKEYPDIPSFKVIKTGADIDYSYIDETGSPKSVKIVDGANVLPASHNTLYSGSGRFCGFGNPGMGNSVTITQIPSHAGALYLDGVNDFGKVTEMPVYKDYTFIIDRQIISIGDTAGIVASKSEDSIDVNKQGAFLFEYLGSPNNVSAWSFYKDNGKVANTDFTRGISYQSKYSYNGIELLAGTAFDSDKLWLGTLRDKDSRFANVAIYSLMSFPYSMSEFLIERQLKKHKLGTLYPDMVEWRPIIKSNSEYTITAFSGSTPMVIGSYYPINTPITFHVKPKGLVDEVVKLTINGKETVFNKVSNTTYIYDYSSLPKSPQKIDITIDEYIRYEDIVQPYPAIVTLKQDGKDITWGDKLKVGGEVLFANKINLLPDLYQLSLGGAVIYNETVVYGNSPIKVEKSMVFKNSRTYLKSNEPKCILSPSRLRIPNSIYKILGYIPDLSGNGNHGIINNSAYAEGSGVNADGSYQLDGVDDFITIPTTVGGKQVLMKVNWQSAVNTAIIYDQRNSGGFAILNGDTTADGVSVPAYEGRNAGGSTYIDGILNEHIYASQLKDITHNITAIYNPSSGVGVLNPRIGISYLNVSYTKMSLYDFMLFDEISTDEEILTLNEYIGIEPKVTLPPYYWDAYGKSNTDEDKATIQQRGVAVGDYDLTNNNLAYEGMSGYGGYSFKSFNDSQDWEIRGDGTGVEIVSRDGYSITIKKLIQKLDWQISNNEYRYPTILDKELPFKCISNKKVGLIWELKYRTEGATSDTTVTLINQQLTPNVPLEINLPYKTQDELTELGAVSTSVYYFLYFSNTTLEIGEEYTVEMLPLYPNGLVYDGVEDFSDNKNVPIIDDFTVIAKRTWLEENTSDKPFIIKGDSLYPDGNQNAFLFEYGKLSTYSFGQNNKYDENVVPSLISWATPTSYNGTTSLVKGSAIDTVGIDIAHATKMVLYKLILYPKTISLLEINFLKNLMEKDEIIDLTNPIFIQ